MISLTKTQLKVLAYLIDNRENMQGIRELAKSISTVYYLVQKNVHQLKKKKAVELQKAGKTMVVKISEQADSSYLAEAENFKRELFYKRYPYIRTMLKKIIKEAKSCFFILIVFGSYAKKPSNDSDLDILAIAPDQNHREILGNAIRSAARTSTIIIHEEVIEEKSFISMIQKKELNVGSEAMENHIIAYGAENYYKLIR